MSATGDFMNTRENRKSSRWAILIGSLGFGALLGSMAHAAIPASKRQMLLDIYADAGGANWATNTGWNGAPGTECSWYGVSCDDADAHVTAIDLSDNNLTGTVPALTVLSELRQFWFANNALTGSPPDISGLQHLLSASFFGISSSKRACWHGQCGRDSRGVRYGRGKRVTCCRKLMAAPLPR
jgi:hypothetical protein